LKIIVAPLGVSGWVTAPTVPPQDEHLMNARSLPFRVAQRRFALFIARSSGPLTLRP
jgi:hypothetical protein